MSGAWRDWRGGARPVSAEALVEVRLRYSPPRIGAAGSLHWSHDLYNAYGADDIVAYRLVSSADPAGGDGKP